MNLDKYKEKNHDLVSGEFPRENRPSAVLGLMMMYTLM